MSEPDSSDGEPDSNDDAAGRSASRDALARFAIGRAVGKLQHDPLLFVPFVIVGVWLTVVDQFRLRDRIPVDESRALESGHLQIDVSWVPAGRPGTERLFGSLVDLHPEYLLWAVGIEVLVYVSVALAGVYTIGRALGRSVTPRAFVAYLGLVVGIDLYARAAFVFGGLGEIGILVGIGAVLATIVVFVWGLLTPALVVAGRSPVSALGESVARTRGHGWSMAGLVVLFALGVTLLSGIPYAGTATSFLVVGTFHAVVLTVVLDELP